MLALVPALLAAQEKKGPKAERPSAACQRPPHNSAPATNTLTSSGPHGTRELSRTARNKQRRPTGLQFTKPLRTGRKQQWSHGYEQHGSYRPERQLDGTPRWRTERVEAAELTDTSLRDAKFHCAAEDRRASGPMGRFDP